VFGPNQRSWQVSEERSGLGLCCAENGLFLANTSLLDRRPEGFSPRPQAELEVILSRGFRFSVSLDRVMGGLSAVASALNAGDLCRVRIAAVHLRIPDLPDAFARLDMQLEDVALKLDRIAKTTAAGDWNPAGRDWDPDKHPRAGTGPNPGWFAPTSSDGDNVSPTLVSDKLGDDGGFHLPPGERNDEIGDLLEWIANASPDDADAINAEIKRVFSDAGDFNDGAMFHAALGEVLRHPDQATRERVLETYEPITHHDPVEIGQANPMVEYDREAPPVLCKYAGVKSWGTFARSASLWVMAEKDGVFRIEPNTRDSRGAFTPDRDAIETLPAGSTTDELIERMIEILQEAAGKRGP